MIGNRPEKSAWCVVANVTRSVHVEGRGGNDYEAGQLGTRHFKPGAKLHLIRYFPGMGFERFDVMGFHRGGSRLIQIVMSSRHMENFRAKQVWNPAIVAATRGFWTEETAKEAAEILSRIHATPDLVEVKQ